MHRFLLLLSLFSPLVEALQVTNLTYSNVREGSVSGRVDVDVQFDINYRLFSGTTGRANRYNCIPEQNVYGYAYAGNGSAVYFLGPVKADVVPDGFNNQVPIRELVSQVTPENAVVKFTMLNAQPGSTLTVVVAFGSISTSCYDFDVVYFSGPGGGTIPPLKPHCDINVLKHLNHGAFTLRNTRDTHLADGAVNVTCDSPAEVTVSTGASGSIKINDTLSTNITVDGKPNASTKTVSGTEKFDIKSEIFLTSVSDWAGKFDHPVVMTISWP